MFRIRSVLLVLGWAVAFHTVVGLAGAQWDAPPNHLPWWSRHTLLLLFIGLLGFGAMTALHVLRLRVAVARARSNAEEQTNLARSRQALLESALGDLPVGLLLREIPADGKIVFSNHLFRKQFGFQQLPLAKGDDFWHGAITDPQQRQEIRQAIEADIASGDAQRMTWDALAISNDRIGERLFNGKGIVLPEHNLMLMVTWDVTEDALVRDRLAAVEARYRHMYEGALVAIWDEDFGPLQHELNRLRDEQQVTDLETYLQENTQEVVRLAGFITVNDVNEATLAMFDATTRAELIQEVEKTFHPSAFDVFRQLLLALWTNETSFASEVRYVTLKGRDLWAQLSLPLPASGVDRRHIPLTIIDITDLHQAEQSLRASESRYSDLYNNSNVGIWDEDFSQVVPEFERLRTEGVLDLETYLSQHPAEVRRLREIVPVRDINQAALNMFQVADLAELQRRLSQLWTEDTYRAFQGLLVALWNRQPDYTAICRCQNLAGVPLWVRIAARVPRYDTDFDSVPVCLIDVSLVYRAEQELRNSRQRFERLFRTAPVSLWEEDFSAVLKGLDELRQKGVEDLSLYFDQCPEDVERFRALVQLRDANDNAIALFEAASLEELIEHQPQLFTSDTLAAFRQFLQTLWSGGEVSSKEVRCLTLKQQPLRVRVTAQVPVNGMVVTVCEDLTALRQQEETLHKLSHAIEQSSVFVVITNKDGMIEYINPALTKATGYTQGDVQGQKPSLWQSGYTSEQVYREMWDKINAGEEWSGELYNRKKNGDYYWELATISPLKNEHGEITHFIGIKEDISQLKEQEMQLMLQAHYDELTGLPNRTLVIDRLEQAVKKCQRAASQLALLFVDLDYFKDINDSLGHDIGDNLLVEAASRIKHAVRASDTVGRFGGDEFVVLIEGVTAMVDVESVAQKINEAFEAEFTIGGHEISISCSIGIALLPENGTSVQELLKAADTAMYKAKDDGRNTYHFFAQAMSYEATERLLMETRLRHALTREDLSLHYQPLVRAEDGVCIGAEALMRWQDAEMGLVPPDRFIPLAEDVGKIVEMGDWALREACVQIKRWRDTYHRPLQVAVNVSPRQLYHRSILPTVQQVLQETGLPPECLIIEVTEGLLIQDHRGILDCLQELKNMGVTLSVDDFGTGYSSLSYLKKFPFDHLKIDRSFVGDLDSEDSATLVRAILAMADGLGLSTVGEGVETSAQNDFLQRHGCDVCQGYLFGKPVPAAEFETFLRTSEDRSDESPASEN